METLPVWLQWLVSLATILSSIGVIIAFVQLRISSKQFNEQLKISSAQFQDQQKLTKDQFKLINQGFLKLSVMQLFAHDQKNGKGSQPEGLDPECPYIYGKVKITLENVGNLPVTIDIKRFKVFFKDQEIFSTPPETLASCHESIYPNTSEDFVLAAFPFNEQGTGVYLADIATLEINYSLLIEYLDYNDMDKKIKTIDRTARLVGDTVFNTAINDKV